MRIVGEIIHPDCRITLYSWNNRYLIKIEQDFLEQTFKIDQFEVQSDDDLKSRISEDFIQAALTRFNSMHQSVQKILS